MGDRLLWSKKTQSNHTSRHITQCSQHLTSHNTTTSTATATATLNLGPTRLSKHYHQSPIRSSITIHCGKTFSGSVSATRELRDRPHRALEPIFPSASLIGACGKNLYFAPHIPTDSDLFRCVQTLFVNCSRINCLSITAAV